MAVGDVAAAWQTIATSIGALDGNGNVGLCIGPLSSLKSDRVATDLDECLATGNRVGTGHVWSPVADIFRYVSPNAALYAHTSRVDVIVSRRRRIVRWIRHGHNDRSAGVDDCRDEHGFIARQDCLAERHNAAHVVLGRDGASAWNAISLVRKRLGQLSARVAKETTVH